MDALAVLLPSGPATRVNSAVLSRALILPMVRAYGAPHARTLASRAPAGRPSSGGPRGHVVLGGVVAAVVVGLLVLDWVMAGRVSGRIRRNPPQSLNADLEATQAMLRRGENKSGT